MVGKSTGKYDEHPDVVDKCFVYCVNVGGFFNNTTLNLFDAPMYIHSTSLKRSKKFVRKHIAKLQKLQPTKVIKVFLKHEKCQF